MNRTIVKSPSFFSHFLSSWWWAGLFLLLCWAIYAKGMQKKKEIFSQLDNKIKTLEQERSTAHLKNEDLLAQINSQSDPAWIELLMMKKLGVVPEGQTKVYFEKE